MLKAKYLALFVLLSLAIKASISQKNFSSKDSENLIRASYAGFYNFFPVSFYFNLCSVHCYFATVILFSHFIFSPLYFIVFF